MKKSEGRDGKARQEKASDHEFILLPFMHSNSLLFSSTQSSDDKDTDEVPGKGDKCSAFLYGTIEEEVYVCQPPGFEDPHFPNKVYKVEKALYGLHQAPKAWYETLSTYLLENGFRKGTIDKTLFIKKDIDDILLVHVYVDDIIFRSTKKYLCDEFEQMMHKRFQMSSMGELTFFLGLQVKPKDDESSSAKTKAEDVDVNLYRSMIRSLMYLIAFRHDIMFAVCAYAWFQVKPKTSHLYAVKRIFRYLKGQPKLGLWYLRDLPFDLEDLTDSDYAGASLDRISTTGDGKKVIVNEASIRCDLTLDDAEGTTCLSNVAIFKELARMGVKKLDGKKKKRTHRLKRLYKVGLSARIISSDEEGLGDQEDASKQGRIAKIDANEDLSLINETAQDQGRMNNQDMFGVNDLDGDEVVVDVSAREKEQHNKKVTEKEVSIADPVSTTGEVVTTANVKVSVALTTTTTTDDELTLAHTLIEIKAAKPKALTTVATTVTAVSTRPKKKGIIMQEPSETPSPKPIVSSQQPSQPKDKGKAKMVKPKRPLKRKKKNHFEMLRAEERRRKPPTKAQKRNKMCTYLKNMAGFSHNQLKSKIFKEVQQAFNKTMDWINNLVVMDSEAVKDKAVESSKRLREELESDKYKKQKLDENVQAEVAYDDTTELKRYMKIVPEDDDEMTIEATPLSSKSPAIVDYKIYKERKKSYFKSLGQMETHKTI
nr:hypothetical protein [Tanacetum cinerariifolium]